MSNEWLIAKLEAATGPDRELDLAIHELVNGHDDFDANKPHYTASIDAALRLAPKNWSWRVGNLPSGKGFADLGTQQSLQCIEGATPSIALCIAILKARSAQAQGKTS